MQLRQERYVRQVRNPIVLIITMQHAKHVHATLHANCIRSPRETKSDPEKSQRRIAQIYYGNRSGEKAKAIGDTLYAGSRSCVRRLQT